DLFCREPRQDVVDRLRLDFPYPGFIAEFHLTGTPALVWIESQATKIETPERYCKSIPHYENLFKTTAVLHRDQIYGSGMPLAANPAVVNLAASLLGPTVLDFGCGN